MRDPSRNTLTVYVPTSDVDDLSSPSPGDALSTPSVEDLLSGGMAPLPRGAAPSAMSSRRAPRSSPSRTPLRQPLPSRSST